MGGGVAGAPPPVDLAVTQDEPLHRDEFERLAGRLLPINRSGVPERDLEALAWAIRWVVLGTLVDRRTDLDETRERLRALIEGYAPGGRREERPEPQAV